MQVGTWFQFISRRQDVRQPQSLAVLDDAGPIDVAIQAHRIQKRWASSWHAQQVAGAEAGTSLLRAPQVDIEHDPVTLLVDPLNLGKLRVGLRRQPAAEVKQVRDDAIVSEFVDGRSPNFARDTHRAAYRRNENHVS